MWYLLNGKPVQHDQPVISLNDRGLMYGDGCFDTIPVHKGTVFRLEKHLERLNNAMVYLGMPEVCITDINKARTHIAYILDKNGLLDKQAWARFQVWRTGTRGYQTDASQTAHWSLQCNTYSMEAMKKPISLATVSTRRVPASALNPLVKLTNGINYIRAAQQAKDKGADDALMLSIEENISETTKANLFWLKGDVFYTPSTECDLLPGITRQFVTECIKGSMGANLKAGTFKLNELYDADFVFVCNSLRKLVRVQSVDHVKFDKKNNVFNTLKRTFDNRLQSELKTLKESDQTKR